MASWTSIKASRGFTLMEMVIALVILGILALAIGTTFSLGRKAMSAASAAIASSPRPVLPSKK